VTEFVAPLQLHLKSSRFSGLLDWRSIETGRIFTPFNDLYQRRYHVEKAS
jgi:hypothetical protein